MLFSGIPHLHSRKKRDPRIQDPVIFSGKIRKNSEKNLKIRKNRKNSEKYFQKFGKILVRPKKKKKKKKKRSSLKFGGKIRKNTENSEKYFEKFGKILKIRKKTRKKTFKNSEKYWRDLKKKKEKKKGPHSNLG